MRALFVSAQLSGHLDWGGYLETARALQAAGHEVLWATGKEVIPYLSRARIVAHSLSSTGWRWPPPAPLAPGGEIDPAARQLLMQRRSLDQWLDVDRVLAAEAELTTVVHAWKPDLIVGEMFMSAAALTAERASIPFVVAGWPAPRDEPVVSEHPILIESRDRLKMLLEHCAVVGANWTINGPAALRSPLLHVSYWSPGWFGGSSLGAQTRHVGGLPPAPPEPAQAVHADSRAQRPRVFITLGTTFNRDPNFFIAATHAADRLGCQPIVALGSPPTQSMQDALRDRLARSSRIFVRVDFEQTLPTIAAAIHHGGAGTTHALARYAVPQIVVPHAGDQARQAQGVARAGCGIHLPAARATVENLEQGLAQLLPDRARLRAGAVELQREMLQLGGPPRAARLLVACAGEEDLM